MKGFSFKKDAVTEVQVAVEYKAPHWVILICNAGQSNWIPLRSTEKRVEVQDEFGDVIATHPAIQAFISMTDAQQYIKDNMEGARTVYREVRTNAQENSHAAMYERAIQTNQLA